MKNRIRNGIEAVWRQIDKRGPDECWPHLGASQMSVNKRPIQKRRLAWITTHGDIPEGQMVLLKCNSGFCCNPAHMYLGSYKEMAEDKRRAGRVPAKLTDDQVREIRASKLSTHKLGVIYQVAHSTIAKARNRELWAHVE